MTKASIYGHGNFPSPSVDTRARGRVKYGRAVCGGEAGAVLSLLSSTAPEEAEVSPGQHQVSHVSFKPQNISLNRSPSLPRYASVPTGEVSGCRHPLRCRYLQEEGFLVPPQHQGGYFGCTSPRLEAAAPCVWHLFGLAEGKPSSGTPWDVRNLLSLLSSAP